MKRKILTALIILLALILLFPMRIAYKDGGSVDYKAILYTVRKEHSISFQDNTEGFDIGTRIRILGFEVYDDVAFVPLEEVNRSKSQ